MMHIPYKRLQPAELNAMIDQAQAGDLAARNAVVIHMMRLVIRLAAEAARRCGQMAQLQDLVQAAVVGCSATSEGGLVRAIAGFDTARGIRFSTYATLWIRAALRDVLSDNIVSGRGSAARAARIRRVADELAVGLGRRPTPLEVQARLGASGAVPPHVNAIRRALDAPLFVTYFDPSHDRGTDGGESDHTRGMSRHDAAQHEAIAHTSVVDEADVVDAIDHRAALARQAAAFATLTPIEQQILRERYGIGVRGEGQATLQEIGDRLGRSRERIRQIEARALERLREALRACA